MSLLSTKFYVPPLRSEYVSRADLTGQLEQNIALPFTLVSAPAGFGKTSLVAEWLGQTNCNYAWLSLDEQDNQPERFARYFIAAMQHVDDDLGQTALAKLNNQQTCVLQDLLVDVINDLASRHGCLLLVLDDYHLIENTLIDQALGFLVENSPPCLHLVMTSRIDPSLPLPRWRAKGIMQELRMHDLRFKEKTTEAYLAQLRIYLDQADISSLTQKTEGWAAGLQLAGLSLKRSDNQTAFVNSFKGSNRFILDYLTDEVLQALPDTSYQFLLRTAILERFNAQLAEVLTGDPETVKTLRDLDAANLFLVPLDQERRWYRYHHLFADLLRHRLKEILSEEEIRVLKQKASDWFLQEKLIDEAVQLAFEAADYERVVKLLDTYATPFLQKGFAAKLHTWAERLPEDVLKTAPIVCLNLAWVYSMMAELDKANTLLSLVEQHPAFEKLKPQHTAVQAFQKRFKNDSSDLFKLAHEALDTLAEDDFVNRGSLHLILSNAYHHKAELPKSEHHLREAALISKRIGNVYGYQLSRYYLAYLNMLKGNKDEAEKQLSFIQASEKNNPSLRPLGYREVGQAYILREENRLKEAEALLKQGLEYAQTARDFILLQNVYTNLAKIKHLQGEKNKARSYLQEAETLMKDSSQNLAGLPSGVYIQLLIEWGELDEVESYVKKLELEPLNHDLDKGRGGFFNLVLARYKLYKGEFAEAKALLNALVEKFRVQAYLKIVLHAELLLALILDAEGKRDEALLLVQTILSKAETADYLRLFLDEGDALKVLLESLAKKQRLSPYGQRILDAFDSSEAPEAIRIEDLSEAESKVCRLLTARMSYKEIAKELGVSVNTVKTHVQNVYSKLGVHSRSQVIKRVAELS